MESTEKKLISLVTPCYNEQANVLVQLNRVRKALKDFDSKYQFEHIYTDNCSTDNTWEQLSLLAANNPNVKIMRFSNNIGANRAVYMGLSRAKGDAIILIQADLQDPPEMVPEFIKGNLKSRGRLRD